MGSIVVDLSMAIAGFGIRGVVVISDISAGSFGPQFLHSCHLDISPHTIHGHNGLSHQIGTAAGYSLTQLTRP